MKDFAACSASLDMTGDAVSGCKFQVLSFEF